MDPPTYSAPCVARSHPATVHRAWRVRAHTHAPTHPGTHTAGVHACTHSHAPVAVFLRSIASWRFRSIPTRIDPTPMQVGVPELRNNIWAGGEMMGVACVCVWKKEDMWKGGGEGKGNASIV